MKQNYISFENWWIYEIPIKDEESSLLVLFILTMIQMIV